MKKKTLLRKSKGDLIAFTNIKWIWSKHVYHIYKK